MRLEEILPVFECESSWLWMIDTFQEGTPTCPECRQPISGNRALDSYRSFQRTYCKDCGCKFSPSTGTPIHMTSWQPEEFVRLLILKNASYPLVRIAEALGKSQKTVADMLKRCELSDQSFTDNGTDNQP